MYQSELHNVLHNVLHKTLKNITWTRSTRDEDNFRQVVCSALYEIISPNNVEIPSTRSGHGDIRIFGRKIELKYASNKKVKSLEADVLGGGQSTITLVNGMDESALDGIDSFSDVEVLYLFHAFTPHRIVKGAHHQRNNAV